MKYNDIELLDFLHSIQDMGIDLLAKEGNLKIIDNKNVIDDGIIEHIRSNKKRIIELLTQSGTEQGSVIKVSREGNIPLSYSQERLWFINQYDDNASYNMPGAIRIKGDLCISTLEKTLDEIIRRHEVLRTNIGVTDGKPYQNIHAHHSFKLKIIEIIKDQKRNTEQVIIEQIKNEIKKPFDLADKSLIRVHLYRIDPKEAVLFINQHHIISDGWSLSIFIKEFSVLYESIKKNKPSPLPELPVQYADFAIWQRENLKGEQIQKQAGYWKQKLSNTPILNLPTDKPRPREQTINGNRHQFTINKTIAQHLINIGQEKDSTLYMTLLSLVKVLLSKYTRQNDISVGCPIANRSLGELEGLLGFFVDTIVLRSELDNTKSFYETLVRERDNTLEAYKNQDVPFEKVVELVSPERNLSHTPLFQVMVVLHNTPKSELKVAGLDISQVQVESDVSKFDLTFEFTETDAGISAEIEYNTDLFYQETIVRMAEHFNILLEQILNAPHKPTREIEILTSEERLLILGEWSNTEASYPRDKCIHELFEKQVKRSPDNIALVFKDKKLTYRELNERANQLAHYLQNKGVKPEAMVGICMERSIEMIVGILGILKAGGAYVPIDPDYPVERAAYILEDSGCKALLTQIEVKKQLSLNLQIEIICLDDNETITLLGKEQTTDLKSGACPNNLIYVIYTSGSTGRPKGTLIEHRNVVSLLFTEGFQFNFSENDTWTLFHSICFDFSVWEIFASMLYGGKLLVIPSNVAKDTVQFHKLLHEEGVTVLNQTPSAFYNLSEFVKSNKQDLSLRYVIFGGEALSPAKLRNWKNNYPNCKLINMYGITETTVHVTFKEIGEAEINSNLSNIGKPIPSLSVYILDENQKLLPVGARGEICVSGAGLSRGYLKNIPLTQEKFIEHPFRKAEKLYRSGDSGYLTTKGELIYCGRLDNQVKIRGFRIELGEVETALNNREEIKTAIVLAKEDKTGNKKLVAYVVFSVEGSDPNIEGLREGLKESLPEYMIPSLFVKLDKMPLTSNGKVDRNVLPEPEGNIQTTQEYVAPQTKVEKSLAKIWQEVLAIPSVGVHDNFFELGGDSIISIQVVSRATQQGLSITAKDIFKNQTIRELSKAVGSGKTESMAEQGILKGAFQLTPIQTWFFENEFKNRNHWNQAIMLEVPETPDPIVLEKSIQAVIEHHDVLRLRYYKENNGIWKQEYLAGNEHKLEIIDLSDKGEKELSKIIEAHSTKIQSGLSIEKGKLIRTGLFKTPKKLNNHLLLAIHHLAIDGVSWRILLEDLQKAYILQQDGKQINLGAKTSSFRQWTEKLYHYAESETLAKEIPYWEELVEKSHKPLPVDKETEENTVGSSDTVFLNLDKKQTQQLLKETVKAYNTEINDLLLSALAITLKTWTGEKNITINLEGHGREGLFDDINVSRTLGWFTSLFPVSLNIGGAHSLPDIIKSIKEQLRGIPNKGIGYGILRYLSKDQGLREKLGAPPTYGITFNYLGQVNEFRQGEGQVFNASEISPGQPVCQTNLRTSLIDVNAIVNNGKLKVNWTYSKNRHHRATIKSLASAYMKNLQDVIEHCTTPGVKGATPSDFPLCRITQDELDKYALKDIPLENVESLYPLSPMQEGMLFHTLYAPNSEIYVTQMSVGFIGELDYKIFQQSWQHIFDSHTILRTSFVTDGVKQPLQRVHKKVICNIKIIDHSNTDKLEQENKLQALLEENRIQGFDVTKTPLSRFVLVKCAENQHTFIWTHHHILIDGWCLPIIFKELIENYKALSTNKVLGSKIDKYKDFIAYLSSKNKIASEQFWKNYLEGFTHPTQIQLGNQIQKGNHEDRYEKEWLTLGVKETHVLKDFAKKNRLTINTIVQGTWAKLLQVYSGTEDVVFGVTTSGRPPELEGIEEKVGLFINTLPLRVKTERGQTVLQWLETIQEQQSINREHEHVPLMKIKDLSKVPNNIELFNTILVFENYPMGKVEQENTIGLSIRDVKTFEKTNYPLTISATIGESLKVGFSYNTSFYKRDIIGLIKSHFYKVLTSIINKTDERVLKLEIITKEEKKRLLIKRNDTKKIYPENKFIHKLIEEQAAKVPNKIAVKCGEDVLTFKELNEKANYLAGEIQKNISSDCKYVPVFLNKCLEYPITILAVLKQGLAFAPLDIKWPLQRIKELVLEMNSNILIVNSYTKDIASKNGFLKKILLNIKSSELDENEINNKIEIDLKYPMFVVYTSGTTGKPKGAINQHEGIMNRFQYMNRRYGVKEDDVILMSSNIAFDSAVWQVLWPLTNGKPVIIPEQKEHLNLENIIYLIEKEKITITDFVPSVFNVLVDNLKNENQHFSKRFRTLRQLLIGGEAMSSKHIYKFKKQFPHVSITNTYGPCEASIGTVFFEVPNKYLESIPIGKPIDNVICLVLDKNKNMVPEGIAGELYLGGVCVGLGYLNNEEQTNKSFLRLDIEGYKDHIFYKTGDLVKYQADGNLLFLGRRDKQVKIMGVRIELQEIEASLNNLHGINTSVVLVKESKSGNKYLIAYYVPSNEEKAINVENIRKELHSTLPEYMIPRYYISLGNIPLTTNGKVDHSALPEPKGNIEVKHKYVAPKTETEKKLAAIWQEVLGLDRIGIYDNFFDLGGHSLLSIKLLNRINVVFNTKLPVSIVFHDSTIEKLAKRMESKSTANTSLLVPLHTKGNLIPIFCVPGSPGYASNFQLLSKYLGDNQPVYGLEYAGIRNDLEIANSIEKIASQAITELKRYQAEGPYILCGHSFGAIVAYEIAVQLYNKGEEIRNLIILDKDSPVRSGTEKKYNPYQELCDISNVIGAYFDIDVNLTIENIMEIGEKGVYEYVINKLSGLENGETNFSFDDFKAMLNVVKVQSHINYVPDSIKYNIPITYYKAYFSEQNGNNGEWGKYSNDVTLKHVLGGHVTLIREPFVQGLSQLMMQDIIALNENICQGENNSQLIK